MAIALPIKLNRLESINIQRFFRRNFVVKAVLFGRILLALAALALVVSLAYDIYLVRADTSKQIQSFNERLAVASSSSHTPSENKPPANFNVIAERKMFGALGVAAVQPTKAPKPLNATQFALIGTFLSGQDSFAIIEEQKKKTQETFLLNDSVFGEAKLTAIFSDRVEINRNGQKEVLMLDTTPDSTAPMEGGVAQTATDEFVVDEAELDKALENLPMLLTQARAVPFFKEGRAVGLRLFAIRAGSLFEKIGLQNGDVLKSVNGNSLGDLSQALQLFQKLKQERSISVTLERNSAERQFRYEIR